MKRKKLTSKKLVKNKKVNSTSKTVLKHLYV